MTGVQTCALPICFPVTISNVVMIPAGYLAYKGEMNMYLVILFGILGSLAGAIFNYYFALKLGRRFLMRYGKYILISEDTILKMEEFLINMVISQHFLED